MLRKNIFLTGENIFKTGFFFFPVKTKSARESHFCPFFRFSSRVEKLFHGHFFPFFPVFFTGTQIGFTGRTLSFSRGKLLKIFHGHRFFSRVEFDPKSSRARFSFHGHFLGKNLVFFTGGFFFFTGKKKNPDTKPKFWKFYIFLYEIWKFLSEIHKLDLFLFQLYTIDYLSMAPQKEDSGCWPN